MVKNIFKNKFLAAVVVFGVVFCWCGQAEAYFSDNEEAGKNSFSLGTLDLGISEDGDFVRATPGESNVLTKKVEIKNQGSLDFQYKLETKNLSGDYCSELELEASKVGGSGELEREASGLPGFECKGAEDFMSGESESWELRLVKPEDESLDQAKSCEFDVSVTAWQTNFADESQGFWDEEKLESEIAAGPGDELQKADHIVINEIYNKDTNDWIELYNPTDQDVDLMAGEYRIERSTSSGNIGYYMEIGDTDHGSYKNTTIAAGGYYLITREDANEEIKNKADAIIDSDKDFALTENNAVYLATGPVSDAEDEDVVDFVGYGDNAPDYEGQAPAPAIEEGKSIQREELGVDNNENGQDFVLNPNPNPENSGNDSPPEVVLNEFLPNSSEETYEYVELYNNGSTQVDLEGYYIKLQDNTKIEINSFTTKEYAGSSTKITSNGFLAVTADLYEDLEKHNDILDDSAGILTLYSPFGQVLDSVEYPLDGDNSEKVREDKTLARIPDGTGDWVDPAPTPGEPNTLKSDEDPEQEKGRGVSSERESEEDGHQSSVIGDQVKKEEKISKGQNEKKDKNGELNEKEVEIVFAGEPELKKGLEIEIEKKYEKAVLEFPQDFKGEIEEIEVDLADLEFEDSGKFEFTARELFENYLSENEDLELNSPEKSEVVLEADVSVLIKEIEIDVSGDLELDGGLEIASQKLKIEEVEVLNWKQEDEKIELDIEGLGEVEEAGEIEVRIEDLDLPEGAKIVFRNEDEVVLKIEVAEKEDENEEDNENDKSKEKDQGEEDAKKEDEEAQEDKKDKKDTSSNN
jgi:hypothetical protein